MTARQTNFLEIHHNPKYIIHMIRFVSHVLVPRSDDDRFNLIAVKRVAPQMARKHYPYRDSNNSAHFYYLQGRLLI